MHNSKLKILVRAVAFCLLVAVLLSVCNYAMYDDRTYTRLMMHELYEEEDIDLVFISGSITYKGFVPEIWDEVLDMRTFNLGSSSQTPDASYYLLKEVFRHHSPKYVVFATSYISFLDLYTYTNPQRHYILFDYMKPSVNKLSYWLDVFSEHTSLTALLPFMRDKTISPERITKTLEILKAKSTEEYRNYGNAVYTENDEEYRERGYVYRYEAKEPGNVGRLEPVWFSQDNVSQEAVAYFGKMVDLCRENGAELIMVPTPMPYGSMAMQEDYQQVVDFYQSLADANDVALFDFTLVRPQLFYPFDQYFYDHVHLNGPGSEDFSRVSAGVLKGYLEGWEIDREAFFYDDFAQLMEASPYVFNTWMELAGDAYYAYSTCGIGVTPEYRFLASTADGDWQCIQEYSPENVLNLAQIPEETAQLRVEARAQGSNDEYQQFAIMDR